MSRSGRTRACTPGDARTRLESASEFLAAVDLLADSLAGIGNDVVATNAINGAIAAADAIWCVRLKIRSASGNHGDAAELLRMVDPKLGTVLAFRVVPGHLVHPDR